MKITDIVIFTGAGLSAESGISTFRDAGGLWENHNIEEVCHEHTWQKNFDIVHKFYNQRRNQLAEVEPNEAHKTIKRLQDKYGDKVKIITQNVDDLLERAGCTNVLHLHGFLPEMKCVDCEHTWDIGYRDYAPHSEICPVCQSKVDYFRGKQDKKPDETEPEINPKSVKPNICFFYGYDHKYAYMMPIWDKVYKNPNAVVIVVGTDGSVVQIDNILSGSRCKKFLCNLHDTEWIKSKRYEYFKEPATVSLPKVEKWIDENYEE